MQTTETRSLTGKPHAPASELATPSAQGKPNTAKSKSLDFIDFGCGSGRSIEFANSAFSGRGLGIDKSAQSVAHCNARGYEAEVGDLLAYKEKNAASSTLAIDLMPELSNRNEFEAACVNLIRAARNSTVIQHPYFDKDTVLGLSGFWFEDNHKRKVRFKPFVADYLVFTKTHYVSLDIAGVAIFGFGETQATPIFEEATTETQATSLKTIRVVFGRKDPRRFHNALKQFGTGQTLFMWTRSESSF